MLPEASRNFSAVLDSVEHGETLVVTRVGCRVASISRAAEATGLALNDVLQRRSGADALDDTSMHGVPLRALRRRPAAILIRGPLDP